MDGKVGRAAGAMKQICPLLRACPKNLVHILRPLANFRPIRGLSLIGLATAISARCRFYCTAASSLPNCCAMG